MFLNVSNDQAKDFFKNILTNNKILAIKIIDNKKKYNKKY